MIESPTVSDDDDDRRVPMSAAALERWDEICDAIRGAIRAAGLSDERIRFVRVDGDPAAGDPGSGFMIAPAAKAAWFTDAWIDRHLRPKLSRPDLADWLRGATDA